MSRQVRRSLALALAGLLGGLGLVLALFGGDSLRRLTGRGGPEPSASSAPSGSLRSLADPGALADAIRRITDDEASYARFSRGALETAASRARPGPHIDRFHELVRRAMERR